MGVFIDGDGLRAFYAPSPLPATHGIILMGGREGAEAAERTKAGTGMIK